MPRRIRRRTPSPINLESDSDDESFIVQDDHLSDDELTLDSDHTESETDPEDDFEYTLGGTFIKPIFIYRELNTLEFPRTRNVRAELDSGNSSVMSSNSPDTLVDDDRQQPGPSRVTNEDISSSQKNSLINQKICDRGISFLHRAPLSGHSCYFDPA